jgi:hypothetical protein
MEYYDLKPSEKNEIKKLLDFNLCVLANELGEELFSNAFEDGEVFNYEADEEYDEFPEIMQWWIIKDRFADELIENGYLIMKVKGLSFWGRCGLGYDIEADFVPIFKKRKKFWDDLEKKHSSKS